MAKRKLLFRFQRFWFSSRRGDRIKGFTLLELLVTTAIAGGIVSGLLFIVVQLMSVDQRESAQSQTQQEMQLALNYISTEMRDAVYVYTGTALAADPSRRDGKSLVEFLPTSLGTNSFPVIAFWKQQPFPDAVKAACAGSSAPVGVACTNGSSYSLVVYSLSTNNPDGTWKGNARITRYALTEFSSTVSSTGITRTPGYVNPGVYSNNFDTWPYGTNETGLVNLQTVRPSNVTPAALVDFVDVTGPAGACPNSTTTGVNYAISPTAGGRSFYACVNDRQTLGDSQDVLIYLRGNVAGRPGASLASSFLPTLETRVLSRGVLGRVPN